MADPYNIVGDPRRLRLLKAVTTKFENITVANGYKLDIGTGKVFRGRAEFGENDPVPMISILEAPVLPEQLPAPMGGDINEVTLDLVVQGFSLDDRENPTDPAHHLMAAVLNAVAEEKRNEQVGKAFGFKWVREIRIGPGTVRPPDEISAHAYFWVTLTIVYVDSLENPYDE